MNYAKWLSKEEMKKNLEEINLSQTIEKAGIPLIYENDRLYISSKEAHTLIIGSTGSGKTQGIILPSLNLSMKKKESIIINDSKGDLYERTATEAEKQGYQVVVINLEDTRTGNHWNPLSLAYDLYKEGNKDKAIDMIEDLGYYLFEDSNNRDMDPFWINSVINYFTGLVLYLFEKGESEEINLSSVERLSNSIMEKYLLSFTKEIENYPNIERKLSSILKSPPDTRGSILSVFNQILEKYITKENLEELLSKTDYPMTEILEKPTIVYIISGQLKIFLVFYPIHVL